MTVDSIQAWQAAQATSSIYSNHSRRSTDLNNTSLGDQTQTDSVSISSAGGCLSSLMTSLHGVEPDKSGRIRLEDLRQKFQENNTEYGRELTTLLKNAGIDTGAAMEFRVNAQGKVEEVSGHPQKEKIENLINEEHPEQANHIREQSALGSLLNAADKHMEFAKAYAKDPEAAVARYAALFSEYQEVMTLSLEGGGLSAEGQEQA
jgi:hypothetical protein